MAKVLLGDGQILSVLGGGWGGMAGLLPLARGLLRVFRSHGRLKG